MTIVVYRDGVLAADRMITTTDSGRRVGNVRKIIRCPDGSLAGAAGELGAIAAFLAWAAKGCPRRAPPVLPDDDMEGIVIEPSGRIELFDEAFRGAVVHAPFHVLGSGSSIAIGALAAGADAVEAVRIVARWNVNCGRSLDRLTLAG